jgi:hypothetical protein
MAKEITEEKRKTYSLDPERSRELARHSIDMSEELGKTVPRQTILDALVECLKDKAVFTKVRNIIKKL